MKVNFKICFSLALVLIISACSHQVQEIPSTPVSVVSMDDRLLASINGNEQPISAQVPVGIGPDEILFAQGFIWTHSDYGYLIQVDPATNTMVNAIKTDTTSDPNHYCQGLGTDGENIWVCSASGDADHRKIDVVRVDIASQKVVATVAVGKIFNQLNMPYLLDQIWVLSGNADKLIGIDVKTNQPNPAIELGARCLQVAALDNFLYATCMQDNLVIKIDPIKKEVVARQTLQSPDTIAAGKNGIWVSQNITVTRLDPESLNPMVTFTGISHSDIYPTADAVWIWGYEQAILYKIDPVTNQVMELIKPDKPFIKGGGVLATADSIWLSATEDELLLRLSLK